MKGHGTRGSDRQRQTPSLDHGLGHARHPTRAWRGRLALLGPMFGDLDAVLGATLPAAWPDREALNAALAGALSTALGRPMRFAAPRVATGDPGEPGHRGDPGARARAGALAYEWRVREAGEIETRAESWHDLFNAVSWRLFPQAKRALNEGHCRDAGRVPGQTARSRRRDALTLVDESALLLAVSSERFERLNRAHAWHALFLTEREAWGREIHPILFGHGLMSQCLSPFRGLTAKAVYLPVPRDFGRLPATRRLALLDGWLAAYIGELATPAALAPLPVLGIPGWHPTNRDPAFYDDRDYFRPAPGNRAGAAHPGGHPRGRPARK